MDRLGAALEAMPAIAEAVNAFESEAAQLRALDVLLKSLLANEALPMDDDDDAADGGASQAIVDDLSGTDDKDAKTPTWIRSLVDGLPDEHRLVTKGTREHQMAWALIRMTELDEDATEGAMRRILDEDLGVQVNRTQASSILKKFVPRYASRSKVGRSYAYRPKSNALELFKTLPDE